MTGILLQYEECGVVFATNFKLNLVDVSDILFFFLLGEGEWGVRGEGGGFFFVEDPRRRGFQEGENVHQVKFSWTK